MRKFNENEKKIIRELLCKIEPENIDYFDFILKNKYFTKDANFGLIVFPKLKKAGLVMKVEIYDNLSLRKKEIMKFHEFLYLLEYLKTNRLIYISKNDNFGKYKSYLLKEDLNISTIENETNNQKVYFSDSKNYFNKKDSMIYDDNDRVIYKMTHAFHLNDYELIENNLFSLIYVTEELKQLEINNFITDDEKQNVFNRKAVTFSIMTSILFSVLSLILSIYTIMKDENDSVKIDKNQFEQLIHGKLNYIQTSKNKSD
ncbi:hypothetical protein [Flavobacterium mekongense]|uniref:hypothetical protein n=1 Tax=Flavobacterium mekongense TaxID=3379707 RepID=UPI0039999309